MLHHEVMHLFVHAISHYQARNTRLNLEAEAPARGKHISPTVHGRSPVKGSKWSSKLASYCHSYHAALGMCILN
jgi:hypothetical protein